MPVVFCSHCGQEFTVTDAHIGTSFQCYCGRAVVVVAGIPSAPASAPASKKTRKRRKKKATPTGPIAAGVIGIAILAGVGIYFVTSQSSVKPQATPARQAAPARQKVPIRSKQLAKKKPHVRHEQSSQGQPPGYQEPSIDNLISSTSSKPRQLTPASANLPPLSLPVALKPAADPGRFAWSSTSFDPGKVPPAFRIRFPSSPSPYLLMSDLVINDEGVAADFNLVHLMVYDLKQQEVVSKVSKSVAYLNECNCEVSPDGKRLAGIESLNILIWDSATAEVLHRIDTIKPDHPGKLQYLEFAGPDRLVSFHEEETVRVYDVETAMKLNEFQLILGLTGLGGHPGRKVRVSPGGRFLVTLHIQIEAPQKRVLRLHVYDLKTGKQIGDLGLAEQLNRLAVRDLVFSDDGEEVAALLYQQRERSLVIASWSMKESSQNGFYGPFPAIPTRPFTKERHLVWLKDKSGWVHSGHYLVDRNTGEQQKIGNPDQGIRHDAQIIGPNTMLQFWESEPRRTTKNEMMPEVVQW